MLAPVMSRRRRRRFIITTNNEYIQFMFCSCSVSDIGETIFQVLFFFVVTDCLIILQKSISIKKLKLQQNKFFYGSFTW